jgi:ribosomal protein S18 acetylase RimI-like enzyme
VLEPPRPDGLLGHSVQAYTSSDEPVCLAVFDSNVPEYFLPPEREQFIEFLRDLPGPYRVLRDGRGAITACGGWAVRDDGTADLCWGMVRRELHGQGWGRRMTEVRLQGIDATPGVRTIELQTSQHTEGFYEGLGFETVEVRPDGFGPGLHCHVMRRPGRGRP